MSRPLQRTGHRESRYERPNQKWVCGWACEGSPCELGPDGKGRCPAKGESECTPRRDGDRWVCTRLQVFGGACEHGPNPDGSCCHPTPQHPVCRPKLSIKARRGRIAWGATVFTAAVLIFLVIGPWGPDFTSPGDLSGPHASITMAGPNARSCTACHTTGSLTDAPGDGISENATSAGDVRASSHSKAGVAVNGAMGQNAKCLQCHFQDKKSAKVQNPHSIDSAELKKITAAVDDDAKSPSRALPLKLASAAPPPHAKGGRIACATCHREHQGKKHDLTAISNTKCQVCHDQQFQSFASGHPNFPQTPSRQRTISFDHQAHKARHFGNKSFSCTQCHKTDNAGRTMELRSFAQSCASCHNKASDGNHHGEQIQKARQVVLRLPPGLEGPWSREAQAGAPELPATMLLLLAGAQRPATVEALDHLYTTADGGLFAWSPSKGEGEEGDGSAEPNTPVNHRKALARGITQLIDDLQAPKASYWLRHRLARALDADPKAEALQQLANELSGARLAVANYAGRWLPGRTDASAPTSASEMPGWNLGNGGRRVAYRPNAHAAPLLKATFDTVTQLLPEKPAENQATSLQQVRQRLSHRAASTLTSLKSPAGALASCMKCHQTTKDNGVRAVGWHEGQRAGGSNGFAAFPHDTHFSALGENSCTQCHSMTDQSSDAPGNALKAAGFKPYAKKSCARCHQKQQATNSCTSCHQYHWRQP